MAEPIPSELATKADIQELKETFTKEIKESKEAFTKEIHDLTVIITGNGAPEKGFIIRLDRLEQWQKQVNWGMVLIGGAALLNAIDLLWTLISHGGKLIGP